VNGTGLDAHEVMEHAHKRSVRVPTDEQAAFVQEVLGSRLAAAALSLKDTRTLSSWARGGPIRSADGEHRLQVLFRIVAAIDEAFGPAVAAAFLRGSNPALGDQAPLVVLADEPPVRTEPRLLAAVDGLPPACCASTSSRAPFPIWATNRAPTGSTIRARALSTAS
jgi:hypothetical protein